MKLTIAIAGKGGIGKTTLAALLCAYLKEMEIRPTLAVDADPNSNLAEALGVAPGRPLAEESASRVPARKAHRREASGAHGPSTTKSSAPSRKPTAST